MSKKPEAIAHEIIDRFGRTFARQMKIDVQRNTPSELWRLFTWSLLSSARIGYRMAMAAAQALWQQGWTTAENMSASTWKQRTVTLNRSGYARYDESTSRMLGYTSALAVEKYRGDLRKLREAARRDPDQERKLLKEFKGIGDTGVNIFFREVQVAWDELFPFADERTLDTAREAGLPDKPSELVKLVGPAEYPRLVAGLVRVKLDHKLAEIAEPA